MALCYNIVNERETNRREPKMAKYKYYLYSKCPRGGLLFEPDDYTLETDHRVGSKAFWHEIYEIEEKTGLRLRYYISAKDRTNTPKHI